LTKPFNTAGIQYCGAGNNVVFFFFGLLSTELFKTRQRRRFWWHCVVKTMRSYSLSRSWNRDILFMWRGELTLRVDVATKSIIIWVHVHNCSTECLLTRQMTELLSQIGSSINYNHPAASGRIVIRRPETWARISHVILVFDTIRIYSKINQASRLLRSPPRRRYAIGAVCLSFTLWARLLQK